MVTKRDYCVDCKKMAPQTLTPHTLIANGWRVTRREAKETGGPVFEWHCDQCWAKSREGRFEKTEAELRGKKR